MTSAPPNNNVFRIYVEPKLHCRKLLPSQLESEREGSEGSWVQVEPHQVLF